MRCLSKTIKKVWLSKVAIFKRTNPWVPITVEVFGELLCTVYDNSDKVSRSRDKLDSVYQGRESIEKHIERFTTLVADVKSTVISQIGEKIHRFCKGLREELKRVAAIDPTTGRQFEDLDQLILILTRYEAALGGGQERRQRGVPSVAATNVDQDQTDQ